MAIKPQPRTQQPLKPRRQRDDRRSAHQRGYNGQWRRARRQWLAAFPACNVCGWIDASPEMVVDHIKPHRGDQNLFWDSDNWQTLCRRCHNEKTARGE